MVFTRIFFAASWIAACFNSLFQLHDGGLQGADQGVVHTNLAVDLAAFRNMARRLHLPRADALMDSGFFIQPAFGMAAVVDTLLQSGAFQITVAVTA